MQHLSVISVLDSIPSNESKYSYSITAQRVSNTTQESALVAVLTPAKRREVMMSEEVGSDRRDHPWDQSLLSDEESHGGGSGEKERKGQRCRSHESRARTVLLRGARVLLFEDVPGLVYHNYFKFKEKSIGGGRHRDAE